MNLFGLLSNLESQDELRNELEELEQEELDEQLLSVGPSITPRLPDVPTERPGWFSFPLTSSHSNELSVLS